MNKKYIKILSLSLIAFAVILAVFSYWNNKSYNSPFKTYTSKIVTFNNKVCARPPPRPAKLTFYVKSQEVTKQNSFEKRVSQWVENNNPTCAYYWLENWAITDAIINLSTNSRGRAVRTAFLGFAASYFSQLNDLKEFEPKNFHIKNWLNNIAYAVQENGQKNPDFSSYANRYWTTWAVMATALATDDKVLFKWSKAHLEYNISKIDENGRLLEERKASSQDSNNYVFSAGPLIMSAETYTLNEKNAYEINNGAVHKLVKRILDNLDNGKIKVIKKLDIPEKMAPYYTGAVTPMELAWLEVYHKRFPTAQSEKWVKRLRPLHSRF